MSFSSLMSFLSNGRQTWNEYSKWGRMKVPHNLLKSVGMIFINDAFIFLITEFARLAAFEHWQ